METNEGHHKNMTFATAGAGHGIYSLRKEIIKLQTQLKEANTYFETGIKDNAERAGIDTQGLVGMAIVHTMTEEIIALRKTIQDHK